MPSLLPVHLNGLQGAVRLASLMQLTFQALLIKCSRSVVKKAVQIINLCKLTFGELWPFNKNMSLSFINVEFINAGVMEHPLKG